MLSYVEDLVREKREALFVRLVPLIIPTKRWLRAKTTRRSEHATSLAKT